MKQVYLIDKYERWCPENNNGQYIIASFSTMEKAEAFTNKYDPINEEGRRDSYHGLSILIMNLDESPGYMHEQYLTAKVNKVLDESEFTDDDYYVEFEDNDTIRVTVVTDKFKDIRLMKRIDVLSNLFLLKNTSEEFQDYIFIYNPITPEEYKSKYKED